MRLAREGLPALAYRRVGGRAPGVVFLGGFMSDMTGEKAGALDALCREQGRAFLRFDYRGHGASEGRFAEATLSDWLADTLDMLDTLTEGPQVLVGSSMGGWLMLLAALARPGRVRALVGIAPAPDFTRRLSDGLSERERADLARQGHFLRQSAYGDEPYTMTGALLEDGERHCLLDGPIPVRVPVRILHGTADDAVPPQSSLDLLDRLQAGDARLTFVKDGDHRLSEPRHLALLRSTVAELVRA